eukprot:GHVR01005843.1.p1 GENE.GHVR01005843.1~~GHVR01005843.1.p1  ORF type:complete len:252 (-),score=142.08 GHVR01005843.1:208-963(-)
MLPECPLGGPLKEVKEEMDTPSHPSEAAVTSVLVPSVIHDSGEAAVTADGGGGSGDGSGGGGGGGEVAVSSGGGGEVAVSGGGGEDDDIGCGVVQLIEEDTFQVSLDKTEAKSRAVLLEVLGDIPDADMKPPDNCIFVCKLNQNTEDSDLELIFSRFGTITESKIIRDWKTNESLQYAFITFEHVKSAEEAYFRMQDVLIDDRRIFVDFSQSVSHHYHMYKRDGARGNKKDLLSLPMHTHTHTHTHTQWER